MGAKVKKVVTGYVVKREVVVRDETTKIERKVRSEVGRVYHSVDAARALMDLLKKANPDWDLYIHERTKREEMA